MYSPNKKINWTGTEIDEFDFLILAIIEKLIIV